MNTIETVDDARKADVTIGTAIEAGACRGCAVAAASREAVHSSALPKGCESCSYVITDTGVSIVRFLRSWTVDNIKTDLDSALSACLTVGDVRYVKEYASLRKAGTSVTADDEKALAHSIRNEGTWTPCRSCGGTYLRSRWSRKHAC